MEGHMHEHGPLYTNFPFVMFVVSQQMQTHKQDTAQTHRTSIPIVVVSLMIHDHVYVFIFVHVYGDMEIWIETDVETVQHASCSAND